MGATLADGGLNPVTGEQVTSAVARRCEQAGGTPSPVTAAVRDQPRKAVR
jgi:hypothetical protein